MKTISISLITISALVVALIFSSSLAFAVPPDSNFGESRGTCETTNLGLTTTCCWREQIPGSMLGETYCQTCERTVTDSGMTIDCTDKELQFKTKQPASGDSVFPNDGKAIDDSKPSSPITDQRVLPGNEGVLEQPESSDEGNDLSNPDNDGGGVLEQPDEGTSTNKGDTGNVPLNGEVLRE